MAAQERDALQHADHLDVPASVVLAAEELVVPDGLERWGAPEILIAESRAVHWR